MSELDRRTVEAVSAGLIDSVIAGFTDEYGCSRQQAGEYLGDLGKIVAKVMLCEYDNEFERPFIRFDQEINGTVYKTKKTELQRFISNARCVISESCFGCRTETGIFSSSYGQMIGVIPNYRRTLDNAYDMLLAMIAASVMNDRAWIPRIGSANYSFGAIRNNMKPDSFDMEITIDASLYVPLNHLGSVVRLPGSGISPLLPDLQYLGEFIEEERLNA